MLGNAEATGKKVTISRSLQIVSDASCMRGEPDGEGVERHAHMSPRFGETRREVPNHNQGLGSRSILVGSCIFIFILDFVTAKYSRDLARTA